jgi:hypothetical protein
MDKNKKSMKRAMINALTPTIIIILGEFHTVAKPFKSEDVDTGITNN